MLVLPLESGAGAPQVPLLQQTGVAARAASHALLLVSARRPRGPLALLPQLPLLLALQLLLLLPWIPCPHQPHYRSKLLLPDSTIC